MPTVAQLKHAVALAEQIEKLEAELTSLIGGSATSSVASPAPIKGKRGGKRTMSPATIAKMRAAQQARWAKIKGTTTTPSATPKKIKRKMSPEVRARLAAAMKARWAAKKKNSVNQLSAKIANAGQPKFRIL